jgi:murein endopeptidase
MNLIALLQILAALAFGPGEVPKAAADRPHEIEWRNSVAVGVPESGSLKRGVMLPSEGRTWVSWDPVEREKPNRWWRRWGTGRLVRVTLGVVRAYAADHPHAPRVLIGDLSRPHGGDFGTAYGPIGHASHQNGLDVDVYYPRVDGREWTPRVPAQVDVRLAQDLVDRFVAAGAERVFVGPNLPLTGPAEVVVPLVNHDNHLHFRLPAEELP